MKLMAIRPQIDVATSLRTRVSAKSGNGKTSKRCIQRWFLNLAYVAQVDHLDPPFVPIRTANL